MRGGSGLFPPWLSWPPLARWQPTFIEVVPVGWLDSFFPSTHHQHHRRHPHTAPTPGPRPFKREQIDTTQPAQLRCNYHKPSGSNSVCRLLLLLLFGQRRSNRNTRAHPKVPTSPHHPPLPPPKRQIATSRPSSVESCNEEWGEEVRWPESPNHHSKGPVPNFGMRTSSARQRMKRLQIPGYIMGRPHSPCAPRANALGGGLVPPGPLGHVVLFWSSRSPFILAHVPALISQTQPSR